MPAPKIAPKRYSRAEIRLPVTIQSAAAQKVVSRTLLRCSRALYTIEVVLNAIGDQDEVEQVEIIIDTMLDACHADMQARIDDTAARIQDAGLDHNIAYSAPMALTFKISSGQLRRYTDLVLKLDQFTDNVDLLRLNGAIEAREASNLVYEARNQLMQLGLELSRLEGRARAAALKEGGAAVVEEAESGAVDVVTGEGEAIEWLKEAEAAEEELKGARGLKAVG